MNIQFQQLDDGNVKDLLGLFSKENFMHEQDWSSCYCQFYHVTCTSEEWEARSARENRDDLVKRVHENRQPGFVAFENGTCVGWLNAGCIVDYPRIANDLPSSFVDSTTFLCICFIVKEEMRGKKIASGLLDNAIDAAKNLGMKRILALPVVRNSQETHYRGFKEMYLHRGFSLVNEDLGIYELELD